MSPEWNLAEKHDGANTWNYAFDPAYSLIIGLLIASILISFKRRMAHPTHR